MFKNKRIFANRNRKIVQRRRRQMPLIRPNAVVYRGPTLPYDALSANRTIETTLFFENALTSDGAGVYNTVYQPSSSFDDFSDFSSVYDEVRCLSFKMIFVPSNRYTKVTTTCIPGYVFIDRGNSTASTSRAVAYAHESAKLLTLEDPWTHECKMTSIDESSFQSVASYASLFFIKTYFNGLSLATTYGYVRQIAIFQFRGRK
jgi:hypothetical protein